jgi:hypothetical protein
MKITNQKKAARNYGGNKELIKRFVLVAREPDGKYTDLIDARCWMSRNSDGASPMYAAVWVHNGNSGAGKATGCGYCKVSASLADAINNAGIELDTDISGRGESAVREALKAIAEHLGYADYHIVE